MIEAIAASLRYADHGREVAACADLNLSIGEGEFIGILGPSGSGKSSLLYLLSGLKMPTSGEVRYRGRNLANLDERSRAGLRLREFGFVFQQPYLLGYLTAWENVVVAADGAKPSDARDLLARLGLERQAERFPHQLSVGEKQRLCVARALAAQPRVIFADEPTAALDHANGRQVVELLDEHRGGGTVVMVTHDSAMLGRATRVLRMAEGRIQESAAEFLAAEVEGAS